MATKSPASTVAASVGPSPPGVQLRAVESDLLSLCQDARRSIPAVKDAAERVAADLRKYWASVPSSGGVPSPSTGMVLDLDRHGALISQLLQPFILACNHAEAPKKLLSHAFISIQRFVTADTIPATEYGNLVRVLDIQAEHPDEEVRLKVLQLLPLLLSQPSHYPEGRLVSTLLSIVFNFLRDKSPVLKHAAAATIQQTAALMFERAQREARAAAKTSGGKPIKISDDSTSMAAACRAFLQDLLMVAGGLPPQWIKRSAPVPRVLALDLIESALREHAELFLFVEPFTKLVSTLLAPLLLRQIPAQQSFPMALRLFRIARSFLLKLHSITPTPARALVSLLVRMVYAAARGEDFGATASRAIDRFGSSGTRILAEAHKKLGHHSSGQSKSNEELDTALNSLAILEKDEEALMNAVSAIPLGPMPLWKCILLLESLHSISAHSASVPSIMSALDTSAPNSVEKTTSAKKDFQNLVEAIVLLLQRVLDSAVKNSAEVLEQSATVPRSTRSDSTPRPLSQEPSKDRRTSRAGATDKAEGEPPDEEFYFTMEDIDPAATSHSRRPLANLVCPDSDTHIFTSTTGGIQAALNLAVVPTAPATSGGGFLGLVGSVAEASVALVSAAASSLSSDKHQDAGGAESVQPPAELFPASIVLSCLEIIVNLASSLAQQAEQLQSHHVHTSGPRGTTSGMADVTHAHFAAGSLKGAIPRLHKPMLQDSGVPSQDEGKGLLRPVSITEMKHLLSSVWRFIMQGLSAILIVSDNHSVCSYALKAYQSFTYGCGSLNLEGPRDALLANLCRMALPNWNPGAGVNTIVPTLLESRTRAVSGPAGKEITNKNLLVLKTLFNISHCLGGVLGVSWVVLIETFEQFDRLLAQDKNRIHGPSRELSSPGLLAALRSPAGADKALLHPPSVPSPSFNSTDESADAPDDDLSVLGTALRSLFLGTIYLEDEALQDLAQALSDLTINAFAESATAEFAEMGDGQAEPGRRPQPIEREKARRRDPVSVSRMRQKAESTTGVFTMEEAAAADAREIMVQDNGDSSPPPSDSSVVVLPIVPRNESGGALGGLPSSKDARPPFALVKLMETCAFNIWRVGVIWNVLGALFRVLARSRSGSVRSYGLECLIELSIASSLSLGEPPKQYKPGTRTVQEVPSVDLLSPLFDYWRSPYHETRLEAISAVHNFLDEVGPSLPHCLQDANFDNETVWPVVLSLTHAAAFSSAKLVWDDSHWSSVPACGTPPTLEEARVVALLHRSAFELPDHYLDAGSDDVRTNILRESFKLLEMICDDFLDRLPTEGLQLLVSQLSLVSRQALDTNVALRAVGLIWRILEALMPARVAERDGAQKDKVPATGRYSKIWFWGLSILMDVIRGTALVQVPWRHASQGENAVSWSAVEVMPAKPDVRNATIQHVTEFLVSNWSLFAEELWHDIILQHMLPLIYDLTTVAQVNLAADIRVEGETIGRRRGEVDAVRMTVDHARDTVGKQWNETRVLAYQGFVRAVAASFPLLQDKEWFEDVWAQILAVIERSIVGRAAQQAPGNSASEELFLESPDVSVPAVACLHDLVLLVCVPQGPARPIQDEEKYSFDMQVVDGALVRVNKNSDATSTLLRSRNLLHSPVKGRTVKMGATGNLDVRDALWQDARFALQSVCACTASISDDEESVGVALIDALTDFVSSVCYLSDGESNVVADSLVEHSERLNEILDMLWNIIRRRRQVRWAAANSSGQAKANTASVTPSTAGMALEILAEDLAAPKLEIPSNMERAFLRGIEHAVRGLWLITDRRSPDGSDSLLERSWTAVLQLCTQACILSDAEFASGLRREGEAGTNSRQELALPASALNIQACKLLHRILQGQLIEGSQATSAAKTISLQYAASITPRLASRLLECRTQADLCQGHLDTYENKRKRDGASTKASFTGQDKEDTKPTQGPHSQGESGVDLAKIADEIGLQACMAARVADSVSPTPGTGKNIFPVKVWGFGLGGSYGPKGDGSLVVADLAKSRKTLQRCRSYADSLIDILLEIISKELGLTKPAAGADLVEMLSSLLTTLESLVGFRFSVTSARADVVSEMKRATEIHHQEILLVDGSRDLSNTSRVQTALAASDTGLWLAIGGMKAVQPKHDGSNTKPTSPKHMHSGLASMIEALVPLKTSDVTTMRSSEEYLNALQHLGWKVLEHDVQGDSDGAAGLLESLQAEMFLLKSVLICLLQLATSADLVAEHFGLLCRTFAIFNVATSLLSYPPLTGSAGGSSASSINETSTASSILLRQYRVLGRISFASLYRVAMEFNKKPSPLTCTVANLAFILYVERAAEFLTYCSAFETLSARPAIPVGSASKKEGRAPAIDENPIGGIGASATIDLFETLEMLSTLLKRPYSELNTDPLLSARWAPAKSRLTKALISGIGLSSSLLRLQVQKVLQIVVLQ